MATKRGLGKGLNSTGKGLDSLISPAAKPRSRSSASGQGEKAEKTGKTAKTAKNQPEASNEKKRMLKVSDIEPNRDQPRRHFDEEALQELADSVRQYGVLSPILVQKKGDYYEIIAGERRWRAAKLAGLKEVPVIVGEYSDREIVEISLIENIQREDLNPIEEAQAFARLLSEFGLTQEDLAKRVSKSRSVVTNSMRLLKLDQRVQQMLVDGMVTVGHARALVALEDPEQQYLIAQKVFADKLSVRQPYFQ